MSYIRCANRIRLPTNQPPSGREGDLRRVPGNALAAFLGFGRKRWKEPAQLPFTACFIPIG